MGQDRSDEAIHIKVSLQVRREMTLLLRRLIDYHIGYRLRSVEFVRKVAQGTVLQNQPVVSELTHER